MHLTRWLRCSKVSVCVTVLLTLFALWTTGLINLQTWQKACRSQRYEQDMDLNVYRPLSEFRQSKRNSIHNYTSHKVSETMSETMLTCNCSSLIAKSINKLCPKQHDIFNSFRTTVLEPVETCTCKDKLLQAENIVQVHVNNIEIIKGYNYGKDVYIPFSYIQKYFDIYGKFIDKKLTKFEWKHSNVPVPQSQTKSYQYNPVGIYLGMEDIKGSVSARERVKCINGVHGVPISTQWNSKGYYYPIQVAQYGLSHYSKYLVKNKVESRMLIDNGTMISPDKWKIVRGGNARIVNDADTKAKVIFFDSKGIEEDGITCILNSNNQKMVLSLNIRFRTSGKVTVSVLASNNEIYTINYITDDTLIQYTHPDIYYGIGLTKKWRKLTRDLSVDFLKGVGFNYGKKVKKVDITIIEIREIVFQGIGWVGSILLSDSYHEEMFMATANWLVESQDERGGWRVNATRKIIEGIKILPGWYTAMGQGQAISLLCRIYHFTKNKAYLQAAIRATELFRVAVENNGIRSIFMDKYTWYEEYPSMPSLHVLNGFIFSLIGLYDLSKTVPRNNIGIVEDLFNEGLKTLNGMLSLYDNGQGTFYDLRHIEIPGINPNRARWQYHMVHISQLQLFMEIAPSIVIKRNYVRWKKYLSGERSPHN